MQYLKLPGMILVTTTRIYEKKGGEKDTAASLASIVSCYEHIGRKVLIYSFCICGEQSAVSNQDIGCHCQSKEFFGSSISRHNLPAGHSKDRNIHKKERTRRLNASCSGHASSRVPSRHPLRAGCISEHLYCQSRRLSQGSGTHCESTYGVVSPRLVLSDGRNE